MGKTPRERASEPARQDRRLLRRAPGFLVAVCVAGIGACTAFSGDQSSAANGDGPAPDDASVMDDDAAAADGAHVVVPDASTSATEAGAADSSASSDASKSGDASMSSVVPPVDPTMFDCQALAAKPGVVFCQDFDNHASGESSGALDTTTGGANSQIGGTQTLSQPNSMTKSLQSGTSAASALTTFATATNAWTFWFAWFDDGKLAAGTQIASLQLGLGGSIELRASAIGVAAFIAGANVHDFAVTSGKWTVIGVHLAGSASFIQVDGTKQKFSINPTNVTVHLGLSAGGTHLASSAVYDNLLLTSP